MELTHPEGASTLAAMNDANTDNVDGSPRDEDDAGASRAEEPEDSPAGIGEKQPSFQELADRFEETFRRLGPAGWLALVAATMPALGGFVLLWQIPNVEAWLESLGSVEGVLVYVAAFTILAGLALLPTYAQALLAGHAFGLAVGGLAAVTGFALASLVGYVVARRASGDRALTLIDEKPKWRAVYSALLRSGTAKTFFIVTLLRVPPNSPFAITNLVMAATKVPLWIYLLGTVIGMTPRTLAAVYIGTTIVDWGEKTSAQKWLTIIGIVVLLIVIGIIGSMAKRAIDRATAAEEAEADIAAAE
jgi:uncharacterized membrane protein YdjX (TVP38/TMEM64 family)